MNEAPPQALALYKLENKQFTRNSNFWKIASNFSLQRLSTLLRSAGLDANHALQRTPGFAVQLPGAAVVRPAQSRAVLPAMKPGTARAFALRRWLTAPAPGPESLSLGSLGVATRIPRNIHAVNNHQIRRTK